MWGHRAEYSQHSPGWGGGWGSHKGSEGALFVTQGVVSCWMLLQASWNVGSWKQWQALPFELPNLGTLKSGDDVNLKSHISLPLLSPNTKLKPESRLTSGVGLTFVSFGGLAGLWGWPPRRKICCLHECLRVFTGVLLASLMWSALDSKSLKLKTADLWLVGRYKQVF